MCSSNHSDENQCGLKQKSSSCQDLELTVNPNLQHETKLQAQGIHSQETACMITSLGSNPNQLSRTGQDYLYPFCFHWQIYVFAIFIIVYVHHCTKSTLPGVLGHMHPCLQYLDPDHHPLTVCDPGQAA